MDDYPKSYYRQYTHYVNRRELADVPLFERILKWATDQRPERILDMGCGVGYLISEIQSKTRAKVVGVDLSRSAVEGAKNMFPGLSLVRADFLKPPLTPGSFDWILAINVIEHLEGHQQIDFLETVERLLREDGALVLSTPEPRSMYSKLVIHDPTHKKELTREAVLALVGERLAIEEIIYTNSIGRFPRRINRLLSFLFPADILLLARNRPTEHHSPLKRCFARRAEFLQTGLPRRYKERVASYSTQEEMRAV